MPGGLPLQQDQGVEEPLARVLRGGRFGTLPGDRGGSEDKDRRGVRGTLRRHSANAPWPGRTVAQLLRGRREQEAGDGRSRPPADLARGSLAARARARGMGAGRDRRRRRGAGESVRNREGHVVPAGDWTGTGRWDYQRYLRLE